MSNLHLSHNFCLVGLLLSVLSSQCDDRKEKISIYIWTMRNIWNFEKKSSERNFQHFSVCGEGEINFKLSTWSFISDFADNAAAEGAAPDITSTWKCLSTNFKLISFQISAISYKNGHNLSNTWRILHVKELLSLRRRNFVWEFGGDKPDGEWGCGSSSWCNLEIQFSSKSF